MLDTPNSCLLDVTNNTTITTLVSISKNGTSQDEFDQAPPLSSPSSVSTISSPSSLTEVSMTNAATTLVKRPFSTPTDKNECYLDSVTPSTTTDIGQYYWCRYCNITESSLWQHGPFGENTCCNTCYERKNSEDQRNCTLDWGINYYPNRPLDQSKAESTPFLSSTTVLNNVTSKRRRIIESPPDESSTIAPTTTLSSQQSTLTSSDTVHYPIDTSISTTKGKKSTMRSCDLCQSSQTPMWRKGPDGLNT
ncbi:uncharacterized protein BX664DRAFT_23423 [Halteromyces radiatus]|uniref:uncharacterized protein n=1 Tax=Halteromyces radiatus TaxID=101107 RepID=UPI00221F2CE0|nr:uncharacterized protein BX664DRAFT_23423 [Halteromyces radiatus]KAI8099538.1 hypothetical protein BX664DRAFT_23423 [Halteromyces radiatus]